MLSVAGGFKGEILWALSLPNLSPPPDHTSEEIQGWSYWKL